jgi:uncharacterized phiE125 gp8 family phage protein
MFLSLSGLTHFPQRLSIMAFPLKQVTAPATEPILLIEMKNYLRVDIDDDDDLITTLISTARERAEDLTGRCLISQQWQFAMDKFPAYGCFEYLHHRRHRDSMFSLDEKAIILPRGPVLSVDSITYKDQFGTLQTLDPSLYTVDLLSEPARITPKYLSTWPLAQFDTNSINILFTAGYANVPNSFIMAIKLIVGAWYESRAEVVQGSGNFNKLPCPLSAESLLGTYQLYPLGYV